MIKTGDIPIMTEEGPTIKLAAYSTQGDRAEQQDSFGFVLHEQGGMAFICDGMGGQAGGALAAEMVSEALRLAYDPTLPQKACLEALLWAVRETDKRIFALKDQGGEPLRAGSTLVLALVQQGQLGWCSVGDSRAYLLREGELAQFTRDQNYQAVLDEQLARRLIGEDYYRQESARGEALISYLGIGNLALMDYSSLFFTLKPKDRILLISDGLYRLLTREEIEAILRDKEDPREALEALEQRAIQRGTEEDQLRDNTTVILMVVKE